MSDQNVSEEASVSSGPAAQSEPTTWQVELEDIDSDDNTLTDVSSEDLAPAGDQGCDSAAARTSRPSAPLGCEQCKVEFQDKDGLIAHLKSDSHNNVVVRGRKAAAKKRAEATEKSGCPARKQARRSSAIPDVVASSCAKSSSILKINDAEWACNDCNVTFKNLFRAQGHAATPNHLRAATGAVPGKEDGEEPEPHLRQFWRDRHCCFVCWRGFSSPKNLSWHLLQETHRIAAERAGVVRVLRGLGEKRGGQSRVEKSSVVEPAADDLGDDFIVLDEVRDDSPKNEELGPNDRVVNNGLEDVDSDDDDDDQPSLSSTSLASAKDWSDENGATLVLSTPDRLEDVESSEDEALTRENRNCNDDKDDDDDDIVEISSSEEDEDCLRDSSSKETRLLAEGPAGGGCNEPGASSNRLGSAHGGYLRTKRMPTAPPPPRISGSGRSLAVSRRKGSGHGRDRRYRDRSYDDDDDDDDAHHRRRPTRAH